jgi:trk system potassium uptake protein TrkA
MLMYQRLGIETVSSTMWGVNTIADAMCYLQLDPLACVAGGRVELVEIEVPPLLIGRPMGDLAIPGESQVVAVSRSGKAFLYTPGEVFQHGDLVDLAVMSESADRLKTMLATA